MLITDLQALVAAVETGSLSAAARTVGSSQPGVSRRLQRLEAELGARLLERTPAGVVPTGAGLRAARSAEQVLAAVARLRAEVHGAPVALDGVLRVVTSSTPGDHLVPALVAAFTRQHPGVLVDVLTADSAAVPAALLEREADVGFTGRREADARLAYSAVATDEVVLAVRTDHPLAAAGAVPLSDLNGERLVWRERGSGTQQAFLDAVEASGQRLAASASAGTVRSGQAVVAAVRAGSGIGVVSARALEGVPDVVALRVAGLPVTRQLWLVVETGRRRPEHVTAFLEHVTTTADAAAR